MSSPPLPASNLSTINSSCFMSPSGDPSNASTINVGTAEFPFLSALPLLEKLDTRSFMDMFDTIDDVQTSKDENLRRNLDQDSQCTTVARESPGKSSGLASVIRDQSSISTEKPIMKQIEVPRVKITSPTSTIKARANASPSSNRYRSDTSSTNQSGESEIFSSESRKSSISTDMSASESPTRGCGKQSLATSPKLKWLLGDEVPMTISPVAHAPPRDSFLGKDKPLPLPPTAVSRGQEQSLQKDFKTNMVVFDGKSQSLPSRRIRPDTINNEEIDSQNSQSHSNTNRSIFQPSRFPITGVTKRISTTKKHVSAMVDHNSMPSIKASAAICRSSNIALAIMLNASSITDLQNAAMINQTFYHTYRNNEVAVVSNALRRTSLPAWELRQSVEHSVKPSPFRMKSLQRDIATIRALESFVVMSCQTICRRETIKAFLEHDSNRKRDLEDAIWRIWTFCKIFGKGATPAYGFSKQVSWLNGTFDASSRKKHKNNFGTKSERGLTAIQLEDMSEMWRCMEHLLDGFRGQEKAARKAGLFSRCIVTDEITETDLLNTWIHDILSLGPKAVLTLLSCDFEQAKVLGVTRWTPPTSKSRDSFLRAAIEEVYRERLVADAQRKAASFKRTYTVSHSHHRSVSDSVIHQRPSENGPPLPPKELRLDTEFITHRKPVQSLPARPDSQFEIRPDCDPLSAVSPMIEISSATPTPVANPTPLSILSMNPLVSTRLGPSLFPGSEKRKSQLCDPEPEPVVNVPESSVIDPSDKALDLLVRGMKYPENFARRALAMSDSGSGVNLQRAIELLSTDFRSRSKISLWRRQVAELPGNYEDHKTSEHKLSTQDEFCEGSCKSITLLPTRIKDRSQSTGILKRGRSLSARMSMRKSTTLSVILDDEERAIESISETDETISGDDIPQVINQDSFRSNGGGNRVSILSTKSREGKGNVSDSSWRRSLLSPDLLHRMTGHSSDVHTNQTMLLPISTEATQNPISPSSPSTLVKCKTTEGRSSNDSSSSSEGISSNLTCMPSSSMGLQRPRVTLMRVGTARSSSVMSWRVGSRREKANKGKELVTGEVIGYAY